VFLLDPALLFVVYSVLKRCLFRICITQPGRTSDSTVMQTDAGMPFAQQGKLFRLIIAVAFARGSTGKTDK